MVIKGHYSKNSVEEIKKDIRRFGVPVKGVYLLNTGDYMATSDGLSKEARIGIEKYGAIDITDVVLGR